MNKKIITLLLIIAMLVPVMPVYANTESEWAAEASFGGGFNQLLASSGTTPVTETIENVEAWKISGNSKSNYAIDIDLDAAVAGEIGNNNVLVEVDYYDREENGWFYINYNSRDEASCYTDVHYMAGSKKWTTASFILEAPDFEEALKDFSISTLTTADYSAKPVYISGVRIKALDETKPAAIKIVTNRAGNIYFSDEEWRVGIETENKLDSDYTADLTIYLKDIWGNVVHTQKDALILEKNGKSTKEIEIKYNKLGVYTIHAEAINEDLKYRFSAYTGISYIKKSDFINDRFGVNNKFGYMSQSGSDPKTVFSLMKNAGIGWSRDEVFWSDFEVEPESLHLNERHKEYLEAAQKEGIKQLIIYGYGNKNHTASDNTLPTTMIHMAYFGSYVYELTKQASEYGVTDFEILNEYNHYTANRDLTLYDDICRVTAKKAREAAEEVNSNVNIVGFAASQYNAIDFMKEAFDAGAGDCMDAVSFHNYHSGSPLSKDSGGETKEIRDFIDDNYPALKGMPVWKTEMGWSRGGGVSWVEGTDALGQAKYIPQELFLQLEAGAEKVFQYQFMSWYTENNTDITDLEMAWGMIDPYGGNKNPYGARPALASVAAMNSVMGTPEFKSKQNIDDLNIYHFIRQQDGKDTAALWLEQRKAQVTLKIPDASIRFYDMYANPLEVLKIGDEYTFNASDEHIYIVGEYETIESGDVRDIVTDTMTEQYDFSDYISGTPAGFSARGQAEFLDPDVVDSEHGTSISMTGNLELIYDMPKYPEGTTIHIGFDFYGGDNIGPNSWGFALSADNKWDTIFSVANGGVVDTRATEKSNIPTNSWNRFDVRLTVGKAGGNAYCETFINGELKGSYATGTDGNIGQLIFATWATDEAVYIDNFRFDGPYCAEEFKVISKSDYIYEGTKQAFIEFNDTILPESFNNDTLTAVQKDAEGIYRNIGVTGIIDGRKLKLTFDAPVTGSEVTVKLPPLMQNICNEISKTTYVDFEVIPTVSFYDDFESYTTGAYLIGDTVEGTGWVMWDRDKWVVSEVFTPYHTPLYGQAGRFKWNPLYYTIPNTVDRGVFVISFDMAMGGNAGNSAKIRLMNNDSATDLMAWCDRNLHASWNYEPNGFKLSHPVDTWGHYDIVLDYEIEKIRVYKDNCDKPWIEKPMEDVTGIRFEGMNNNEFALDNFYARHLVECVTSAELEENSKNVNISFRSAVDATDITADNITVIDGEEKIHNFAVKNANWYGAELEFENELTAGEYRLIINNVNGIMGEPLSHNEFTLSVVADYKVNTLSVVDDNDAKVALSEWAKDKQYYVKADVVNTYGEEKSFYAFVAGFNGGNMTAVSIAEFKGILKNGEYKAALTNVDMKGATELKLFAFDSPAGIKPLISPAVVIE